MYKNYGRIFSDISSISSVVNAFVSLLKNHNTFKPKILLLYTATSSNDANLVLKYDNELDDDLVNLNEYISKIYNNIQKRSNTNHGVVDDDINLKKICIIYKLCMVKFIYYVKII